MKSRSFYRAIIIMCIGLIASLIHPHGFAENTYIRSGEGAGWLILNQTAHACAKKQKVRVASYDTQTHQWISAYVTAGARSKSNCYCRLSFDECSWRDIRCTPSQLFYRITDHTWVPAYLLKAGDFLLAENNKKISIRSNTFIKESLAVYTLEVNPTHIFLVGEHSVVAHNMLVPISAAVGLSIPFSTGCGGSVGLIFGPVGVLGSSCLGSLIGYAIKSCLTNQVHEYHLAFNPHAIGIYFNDAQDKDVKSEDQDKKEDKKPEKNNEAQAPGKPTEKDGFIPKKKWDGKKVHHRRGYGWPDKKESIWIPTGPNGHGCAHWDVQHPDGNYDNIVPGGKIRGAK